jgi:hypothetical protein
MPPPEKNAPAVSADIFATVTIEARTGSRSRNIAQIKRVPWPIAPARRASSLPRRQRGPGPPRLGADSTLTTPCGYTRGRAPARKNIDPRDLDGGQDAHLSLPPKPSPRSGSVAHMRVASGRSQPASVLRLEQAPRPQIPFFVEIREDRRDHRAKHLLPARAHHQLREDITPRFDPRRGPPEVVAAGRWTIGKVVSLLTDGQTPTIANPIKLEAAIACDELELPSPDLHIESQEDGERMSGLIPR